MNKKQIAELDITGKIGPLAPSNSEWPMYSFSQPAYMFWNGFAKELAERGLSQEQIKVELQSKGVRWMLDEDGQMLETLGRTMAGHYKLTGKGQRYD